MKEMDRIINIFIEFGSIYDQIEYLEMLFEDPEFIFKIKFENKLLYF